MKTDVIVISSRGNQIEAVLDQVEKVSAYKKLSSKNALHLRLLAEEMMGMMRSLTGETEGEFWIEDEKAVYQLHLKVQTIMDPDKREQLLAASTSGKNESAKGLMGRLRDFFDRGTDGGYVSSLVLPSMYEHSTTPLLDWEWSMLEYQKELSIQVETNESGAKEAWDELEKSVVAHVADDVKVSIRGRDVEMIIYKEMKD